jgi:crotonobetainyl-CoA:carnitine CoA-transferase CaiB-like acyl-CoA transferase
MQRSAPEQVVDKRGSAMSRLVCEGLNVIEMGSASIPASMAGMLLADNGARVVKIEPPEGDLLRTAKPAGFLVWNRGKESRVIDLRTSPGQDELRTTAAAADVVIEAFAPGVAERWGIGYDDLKSGNPGVVYCSITGFGATGPYAHLPAYEGTVAAKTGHYVLGAFGFRSGPIYNDAPMASTGTGHQAFAGILAALTARETTGRGQQVVAAMVEGLVPFDYFGTMVWQQVQRQSGGAAGISPLAVTGVSASRTAFTAPTGDGRWVNFTHMLPHQAQALSRVLGLGHTVDDPRFSGQPLFENAELAQEWEDLVWDALRTKTYAQWEPILLADENIAFEMARRSEEGLDHAQIVHNGDAITVEDRDFGPVRQVGPVANLHGTPAGIVRSAPGLGENGGALTRSAPAPAGGGRVPAHPLEGVTVVELGYYYAMPYGVTMAAALGARVVKLEDLRGDPMRWAFGNPEVTSVKTMEGKESLSVDLRTPEGRKIVHELVSGADVFVNGFRPGVAERMAMGADELRRLNSRLVYLHAAGYGADGPYAHRPIYAGVASALAGQVVRHAGTWLDPELTRSLDRVEAQAVVLPRVRGPVDGDANAALAVLSSLLLGVYHQRRTGEGQLITTSMIGGNALAYADDFNRYEGKPPLPVPDQENHGLDALYRLYEAKTGWVFVAAPRQKDWEALAGGVGRQDLATDERFATADVRRANDEELVAELGAVLATRDAGDWENDLAPKGIAVVKAFEASYSEFTCTDPVLRENGMVIEIEHPFFGRILRAGPALKFSETPSRVAPSCLNGEHTVKILGELGYDDEAIEKLRADAIICVLEG